MAYHMQLPAYTHLHNVFHVSKLKHCVSNPDSQQNPLDLHSTDQNLVIHLSTIIDSCVILIWGHLVCQVLVQ